MRIHPAIYYMAIGFSGIIAVSSALHGDTWFALFMGVLTIANIHNLKTRTGANK